MPDFLGTGLSSSRSQKKKDGRYVIVYNGEIYNYLELRAELEARGLKFASHSDTEVILQLHAIDGDAAVGRLNGIFAYALWDTQDAPPAAGT